MEQKAKRPCKSCPKCNAKFSDRHARRHLLECNVIFCESNESDKESIGKVKESSFNAKEANEISDDEPESEIDYDCFKKLRKLGLNNLEEEDINTHFDTIEHDESSDFSDAYSDVDSDFEFFEETVGYSDIEIKEKAHWFCKVLVLWQCIYYISDAAIGILLRLLSIFFKTLSVKSDFYEKVHDVFPQNVNQLSKLLQSDMLDFKQYVVCTKCFSLYAFEDCFHVVEGCKLSKKCSFIEFPNHRLPHLRKRCNQTLLMEVKNLSLKILVPFKIFCYKSIKSSLQQFVKRSNFEDLCEKWRQRETKEGVLYDIYDGNIWGEFNGSKYDFFTTQGNYGCMLNVDWFQPYKHTSCSIGAMYLAFLNLPREVRHRRENVLLVGIIPDMKSEPKTNTFLNPLIQELKQSWDEGFLLYSHKSPNTPRCFKLALVCVGCDIPASRKLCGFLGHSATSGCNKCKKKFPAGVGEKNYGGFNRTEWIPRDNLSHREECNEILMCTCKGDKEKLERQFGTRYSSLLDLEYFDPVRMTPIDPMHNLFLGTAKHMITVWKTKKLLCDEDFKTIQNRMEPFVCPSDIGRLPNTFSSSFGSFNADQFKNWTLLFSVYALQGILPEEHLNCWRKFVLACRRLCSMFITVSNVKVADRLLIDFLMKFEDLYGTEFVTPNMHLHGHLYDCILDYGPVYSFWLFSFERENGILGSYKTNKKKIEVQLMKRFSKESWAREKEFCMNEQFTSLFNELSGTSRERGTLGDIYNTLQPSILEMSSHCTYP